MSGGALGRSVALVRAEHLDRREAAGPLVVALAALVAGVVAGVSDDVAALSALRDLALLSGVALGAVVGLLVGAPGARADAEAAVLVPRRTGVVLARAAVAAVAAALGGLLCGLLVVGGLVAARAATGGVVPEVRTLAETAPLAPALALAAGPAVVGLAVVLRGRAATAAALVALVLAGWGAQALAGSTGGSSPVAAALAALGPGGPDDGPAAWTVVLWAALPAIVLVPLAVAAFRRRALRPEGVPW